MLRGSDVLILTSEDAAAIGRIFTELHTLAYGLDRKLLGKVLTRLDKEWLLVNEIRDAFRSSDDD